MLSVLLLRMKQLCVLLCATLIGCVELSGIAVEGEVCGYEMKGRRSHWVCYRNQFQWRGEQLGSSIKLSQLLNWNVTLAVRHGALIFCGAKRFKCWILLFWEAWGGVYMLSRFPCWFGGLRIWSVFFKAECLTSGKMNWCVVFRQSKCSTYWNSWNFREMGFFFHFFFISTFLLCLDMVCIEFLIIHKAVVSMKLSYHKPQHMAECHLDIHE